jgi:hypothetical protein
MVERSASDWAIGLSWGSVRVWAAGPPDSDLLEAMRLEHVGGAAFSAPGGGGAMTTPAEEWDLVMAGRCDGTVAPGRPQRRIPDWRELLRAEEQAAVAAAAAGAAAEGAEERTAALTGAEIVAIVLYTGPMVRACCVDVDGRWVQDRQRERGGGGLWSCAAAGGN